MIDVTSLRRLCGLALICASLFFATAVAPAPTPTPPPAPTPAPPALSQQPVVMIYPFDVQTGADARIGQAIAQILGQEMSAAGGITVPPVPQGVKRADFLENARAAHADFYISGYVTPVGDSAAVVEQVVSVDSGVILFSQTAQVTSVADVASQSLLARSEILTFLGRGTQNVGAQASNSPAPSSTNGAQVPIQGIGSIVNSVFKHKGGKTPTPAPVVKPSRGVIVAPVTASGSVVPADLSNAGHELYFALNGYYNAQLTAVTTPVATSAETICGENRNNSIATGTLAENGRGKTAFTFTLTLYTCFGAVLGRQSGTGPSIKSAVDAAAAAYAKAHPDND
ncbi:MAG TPA: hypothetical protein VMU38_04220 [Candidatus Binatia bacterium]|nr:hypothetical protein [Candidatus Binatia bacterium]